MSRVQQAEKELELLLEEWTSTPMGRRAFLLAASTLLASCGTTPKTRYREGDNAGQETPLTVEDERRMTQEVMPKMKQEYPPLNDPQMQQYISTLGQGLVRANGLHQNPYEYQFSVVDVPYVNAFALPAGTVFVTAPLIAMADTEAELVGVLGHEVGHIQARHTAERMAKAEREQKKSWLYGLGGAVLGAGLGYGVGRAVCPPRDQRCIQKATELGGVAGMGGGLLIQKFAFMANSREDEMEADRIGFRTAVRAGYDKDHVGAFYTKLLKMEQSAKGGQKGVLSAVQDAMSTHPPSKERVQQMQELAQAERRRPSSIVSSRQFDSIRKVAAEHAHRAQERAKAKG